MHHYRFIALFSIICCGVGNAESSQPPVILVSIDTLRADHLSAYGYRKIRTPNLDSFAEHGTAFTAVRSQIPLTLPSHTCLFTSTYPFQNGVEENAEIVPAGLVTLASILQQHGYRTGAFIGSDLLSQRFKLDRGFELYDSPFHPNADELQNPYDVRVRRDAALVVRSASQWIATPSDKPPFVFLHLFDLHTPYSAPSADRLRPNAAGYDAEVEYVDRVLGRFRQMLIEKGWWNRSLIILLSDHGESLGEHGEASHGYFIYQSTLWVPLLMHWPAETRPLPALVNRAAGLIDVAPTILDFLHIEQPPSFRGRSLLKQATRPGVYSETVYARDAFRWSLLRSLSTQDWQYIDAPKAELYDLKADPEELKNVIRLNVFEGRDLRNRLRSLMAVNPDRRQVAPHDASPATTSALGSLGYISVASPGATNVSGPDPKDRLAEYRAYENGLEELYTHREHQAVLTFTQLLVGDAANSVARYYLGEAYLRLQRPADALREWKTTLARDPSYTPAAEAIRQLQSQHSSTRSDRLVSR